MPTTRRQFIKRGAGAVSLSLLLPRFLTTEALGQEAAAAGDRKIFVVIQLGGGVDGLNTVIPFTDSRYLSLRPNLGFRDTDVAATMLDSSFALHPAMDEIKAMYDAGKVAIVRGVGYPNSSLSHFLGTDIWMTGNTNGGAGNGWLGKYADQVLFGKSGLQAASLGGQLPKAFFADKVVVPSISNFATYTFQTDARFAGDRNNQVNVFNSNMNRGLPSDTFLGALAMTGADAVSGAAQVQTAIAGYQTAAGVTYPAAPNQLSPFLKMAAQLITTIAEANLVFVQLGGFDNHSGQIGDAQNRTNKLVGDHAQRLGWFSEAVKAFYDDLAGHGLASKTLMMTFSEFGRRPNENASFGTDHGTSSDLFVMGDPVRGGLFGEQPSLAVTELDAAGNMKPKVDFRSVYAEVIDKWLGVSSRSILGADFGSVGFLP